MNKSFFEDNESRDYEKLVEWNKKTNSFKFVEKAEDKLHYDASATTFNRDFIIELKNRNAALYGQSSISGQTGTGKGYVADTLFIEQHKLADLLLDYVVKGVEPLYINFLEDGNVIVFNLAKLKNRPQKVRKTNIYSKGYERREEGTRFCLDIKDGIIYNEKGDVIR